MTRSYYAESVIIDSMNNSDDIYRVRFSEWLQKWANTKHYSQSDLSRLTKIPRQSINQWWNAKARPLPENCRALAQVLTRPEVEALEAAGNYSGEKVPYDDYIKQLAVILKDLPVDVRNQILEIAETFRERYKR